MTHTTHRASAGNHYPLPQIWELRPLDGPVPDDLANLTISAAVPGLVHTALLDAGLIPDPYLDRNEHAVAWIGQTSWEYTTQFDWTPDGQERHDLVFEGLDTVATVTLNGVAVGATRNQHRRYRFAIDDHLREGTNSLAISFASPVAEADRSSLELGYRPHTYFHPFNAIRKAACNFGWDWGPDVASCGIWRPARLEAWSGVRLAAVRPIIRQAGSNWVVDVHLDLERFDQRDYTITATVAGSESSVIATEGHDSAVLSLAVSNVETWWPRGHGGQPLYDLRVEVRDADNLLAESKHRIGFRTVELDLTADAEGTRFRFIVNGEPIWIRGANWIPDEAFITRVTRARLARRMDQAEFAHLNLLRVWGGGYYESEDFYDLCDERGLLVWQDFPFTCASYAEEEPLWSEIEAEARDNITRLLPHPSLALWNGNNENIWGYEEWGWEKRLQGRTWGLGYYLELLPRLVAELDPSRSYTPGSPWSGDPAIFANEVDHGSVHLWELWNRLDYPAYRDVHARFVAEFGWQGPSTWSTLTQAISDQPLTPESPGMFHHQKAIDGNDKLTDGLVAHLPMPDDTEDWHWAMSLNQALAMTVAIEHMRSESPRCMGSVMWQLNDCWPATSWAAVDGYERAKPLLYALRHAYADRLITVQPRDATLAAVAVNDSPEPWDAVVVARRLRFDGTVIAEHRDRLEQPARSTVTIKLPDSITRSDSPSEEMVVVESAGERGHWFFAEYRETALPRPAYDVDAHRQVDGYSVTVYARSLLCDVSLLVDKVDPDAVVDDMLVTLLPGESTTFMISSQLEVDPHDFCRPEVLRTANQLVVDWS